VRILQHVCVLALFISLQLPMKEHCMIKGVGNVCECDASDAPALKAVIATLSDKLTQQLGVGLRYLILIV
jgi:hypothetical protein